MPASNRRTLGFAVAVVGLAACASVPKTAILPKEKPPIVAQPAPEPQERWTPEDEQLAAEVIQRMQAGLEARTASGQPMPRDAHPKAHGCVKAFFEVDAQALPAELRKGVFAHQGESFPAWMRFSNGAPDGGSARDDDGDVRGLAVKLMGLAEPNLLAAAGVERSAGSQDFVLMNSKSFFIRDVPEYADLVRSADSKLGVVWFLLTHSRARQVVQSARNMEVGNPLHVDYYSATPYKLGPGAMKFGVRSCTPAEKRARLPEHPSPDFLREQLVAALARDEACFEFLVQVQTDPKLMPIEDPTAEWPESASPYVKVGKLRIPKQTGIDSKEQQAFCENLSFNPWRTLPETRPLGAVNRVRLQAYGHISAVRHGANGQALAEPTRHELPASAAAQ